MAILVEVLGADQQGVGGGGGLQGPRKGRSVGIFKPTNKKNSEGGGGVKPPEPPGIRHCVYATTTHSIPRCAQINAKGTTFIFMHGIQSGVSVLIPYYTSTHRLGAT